MDVAYAASLLRKIRLLLLLPIAGLVFSGATALPLETELRIVGEIVGADNADRSGFATWIGRVRDALIDTNSKYPFLAYGTDWLAFGHFVIAIAFIGPLRDPVKNKWVVQFGMIACVLVVPFALTAGAIREIPLGWRFIDCAFGICGFIPLWICWKTLQKLEHHYNNVA